jgi:hypothetical protein
MLYTFDQGCIGLGGVLPEYLDDKSAMGAMNRPLQICRFRLLTFII